VIAIATSDTDRPVVIPKGELSQDGSPTPCPVHYRFGSHFGVVCLAKITCACGVSSHALSFKLTWPLLVVELPYSHPSYTIRLTVLYIAENRSFLSET
jgi:hypothetical protein